MDMKIEITVGIPDAVAEAEDDGFGQPCRSIAARLMRHLRTDPRHFEITEASKVEVSIPMLMSRGMHYGDMK